jgi:FMN phosphatase YigB (HAD superfamily)
MKVIVSDLSDVLIKGLMGVEFALSDVLLKSSEEIATQLYAYSFYQLWLGVENENSFMQKLIYDLNWKIEIHQLKNIIRDNFKVDFEVIELYKCLSLRYDMALLSVNCPEWVAAMNEKYNYESLFSLGTHYSYDLNLLKTDVEIYDILCERLNVVKDDIVFIDDSPKNIAVSRKAGIDSILFTCIDELKRELGLRFFDFSVGGARVD